MIRKQCFSLCAVTGPERDFVTGSGIGWACSSRAAVVLVAAGVHATADTADADLCTAAADDAYYPVIANREETPGLSAVK